MLQDHINFLDKVHVLFTMLEVCVKFLVIDTTFLLFSEESYYFLESYMDGTLYIHKRIMLNFLT